MHLEQSLVMTGCVDKYIFLHVFLKLHVEAKRAAKCGVFTSVPTQDAYMEEEGHRGDMVIHSGLSNSTESIDSMKALTAAIEAANAQVSHFYCMSYKKKHQLTCLCDLCLSQV